MSKPAKYIYSLSLSIFVSVFVLFGFAVKVAAFEISPSTVQLAPGNSTTIKLLANNKQTTNGVSVHLTTTNLQIVDVSVNPLLLSIGTCSNSSRFTDTEVCVDIAGQNDFTAQQELATVTVLRPSTATSDGVITVAEDSRYATNEKITQTPVAVNSNGTPYSPQASAISAAGLSPIVIVIALLVLIVLAVIAYLVWKKMRGNKSMDHESMPAAVQPANQNSDLPPLPSV